MRRAALALLPCLASSFFVKEWTPKKPCILPSDAHIVQISGPRGCRPLHAVCEINRRNAGGLSFLHFPHALQHLLPCWSAFQRFPGLQRVLFFRTKQGRGILRSPWSLGLADLMGAKIAVDSLPLPPGACAVHASRRDMPKSGWKDCVQWVSRAEDLAALRRAVRARVHMSERGLGTKGLGPAAIEAPLRVGVMVRRGPRALVHEAAILEAIRAALPNATVDAASFSGLPFLEQARWVLKQDALVTPHGAQNANLAFARPCVPVLELFPRHYYIPGFFLSLVRAAGALPFVAYPTDSPEEDMLSAKGKRGVVSGARSALIEASPANVTWALTRMLKRRAECRQPRGWLQTLWHKVFP